MKKKVVSIGKTIPPKNPVIGENIQKYVYDHLNFELPLHTYKIIDQLLCDMWRNIQPGSIVYTEDFEDTLCALQQYDVLLTPNQTRCLSSLIAEAFHKNGHLNHPFA